MAHNTTHFPLLEGPVAVNLANTLVSDRPGRDLLSAPDQLRDWLRAQTAWLDTSRAPGVRLDEFRELRDVLRAWFSSIVTGSSSPPGCCETLNAYAAAAPTVLELRHDGDEAGFALERRALSKDEDACVLAAIAESGIELLGGPDRDRLGACAGPGCRLFFLAAHPARRWCDSRVCGNRVRVARHARRRREGR